MSSFDPVEDFLLKCRHMRHELLDAELLSFEEKNGDVASVFLQLKPSTDSSSKRMGYNCIEVDFLKCIRDIPSGPAHFIESSKFAEAFRKCYQSHLLNHVVVEIIAAAPSSNLVVSVCERVVPILAHWVSGEDEQTAGASSSVLERLCTLHPHTCVPVLMQHVMQHSSDTTVTLRYARIMGNLLNVRGTGVGKVPQQQAKISNNHSNNRINNSSSSRGDNVGGSSSSSGGSADVVQTADMCNALFDACLHYGCIPLLTSLIQSEDMLTQLVAIEFIAQFGGSQHGVKFLFEQELFQWTVAQSAEAIGCESSASGRNCSVSSSTVDPMIGSACFAQIGEVIFTAVASQETRVVLAAHLTDSIVSQLLRILEMYLDDPGEVKRVAALSTLTALASLTPHLLHVVTTNEAVVERWLTLIQGSPDAQAAVLHSLSTVALYHKDGSASIPSIDADLYRVIELIGTTYRRGVDCTLTYVLRVAQQPVEPVHVAAIKFLDALAQLSSGSGLAFLFAHADFYAYLLDRATENNKEEMETKHGLLQSIARNVRFHLLSKEVTESVQRMEQEGPFARATKGAMADALTLDK